MSNLKIATTIQEVRDTVKEWKSQGLTVGLVPTMGYLHEGHGSLIKASANQCDRTVVSVFLNPTQFAPNEDLESYPRDFEQDKVLCEKMGADLPAACAGAGAGPRGVQLRHRPVRRLR